MDQERYALYARHQAAGPEAKPPMASAASGLRRRRMRNAWNMATLRRMATAASAAAAAAQAADADGFEFESRGWDHARLNAFARAQHTICTP